MGNNLKCVPKLDSKTPYKKSKFAYSHAEKRDKHKVSRWERVLKKYSNYENPLLAFKTKSPRKFRDYLFEGPPSHLRWQAWKAAFSIQNPKIKLDISDQEDTYSIEKDLNRTFPNHQYFSSTSGQLALKNILVSMVNNYPELGYCQGMNSIAGILLIVSQGNEIESYAILESICMKFGGKGLFEYGFPLVVDFCEDFHKELREKIPKVHSFFEETELDDNLWLTKWFMTIFSYSFNLDCVVRIWDAVFAYGLGFMVNVALGLVNFLKCDLFGKTLGDIIDYLPELKEMYVDIDWVLFTSAKFEVKQIFVNENEESSLVGMKDEVDSEEPILTKWDSAKYSDLNARSLMEEFSLLSPSNLTKISM